MHQDAFNKIMIAHRTPVGHDPAHNLPVDLLCYVGNVRHFVTLTI